MSEAVLAALITGGLSLLGVIITNLLSAKKTDANIRVAQAVTDAKLEDLTAEVRKHNNFGERISALEAEMKSIFKQLETKKN